MPASPNRIEPALILAYWSSLTERALLRLQPLTRPFFLARYSVTADDERLVLTRRRGREPIAVIPTEVVRGIDVGEQEYSDQHRGAPTSATLAIHVIVEGPAGPITIPIIPLADDGVPLNWQDSTVRSLAARLAEASGVELVGRPKRVHRSIPDWTLDV